ncbi:MAG: MFS transporter [Proteobacteria bacterium]|nr:MFS transporter [Pseudomonadota bacterium]
MELNRAKILDENFTKRVLAQDFPVAKSHTLAQEVGLDKTTFLELFDSQLISRHLDIIARQLREQNQGFYTIASSGHEGNAAIAKVFNKDDMAFLHYRSGAFMVQRAKKDPTIDIIYDQLLSLVCSSEDPISGGRHKVFGSLSLYVPPQTSTIASHLPKAMGTALSLTTAKALKAKNFTKLPEDSVVLCSFGDASISHSTAQGALNASQWVMATRRALPLVWICEDNAIGISLTTPDHWIQSTISNREGLIYLRCDGRNLADVYKAAKQAMMVARKKKQVVFLHMKTVRLLGHAGSDIESQYRTLLEIEKSEADDPLLHSARDIINATWLTPPEVVALYEKIRSQVQESAQRALKRPKLSSSSEIMSCIVPLPIAPINTANQTSQVMQPKNMAQCLNLALSDILSVYPNTLVFGEDVGKKGGVYRVTADLQKKYGQARVFDTLIDEQTILGTAIGFAHNGFIPIPEIQFLAYVHNAIDQIRGEGATLSFFSKGQFFNPMVIRIPALAYQKGFGGHFHNDNAIAFLREIPGIVIVCPSSAKDAQSLLHRCVQIAIETRRVVVFLEPIALYMVKDLYQAGDNLALSAYTWQTPIPMGELGIEGEPESEVAIISYGNGMYLSRQAAYKLQQQFQISIKLIDLRWLAPLNVPGLIAAIKRCKQVLIVDECRRTGSISEALLSHILENCFPLPKTQRLTGEDCFIPLGKAWEYILPSCDKIIDAILKLIKN